MRILDIHRPFDSLVSDMHPIFYCYSSVQCSIDGDTSSLNAVARALLKLQGIYGIIPNIKGKGVATKKILQKLMKLRVEEETARGSGNGSEGQWSNTDTSSSAGLFQVPKREIDTLVMYVVVKILYTSFFNI
jgi:hypothetical protein